MDELFTPLAVVVITQICDGVRDYLDIVAVAISHTLDLRCEWRKQATTTGAEPCTCLNDETKAPTAENSWNKPLLVALSTLVYKFELFEVVVMER